MAKKVDPEPQTQPFPAFSARKGANQPKWFFEDAVVRLVYREKDSLWVIQFESFGAVFTATAKDHPGHEVLQSLKPGQIASFSGIFPPSDLDDPRPVVTSITVELWQ